MSSIVVAIVMTHLLSPKEAPGALTQKPSVADWLLMLRDRDAAAQDFVVGQFRETRYMQGVVFEPTEKNLTDLLESLTESDPVIRAWAAEALGTIPNLERFGQELAGRAIAALLKCLRDTDTRTRELAAETLAAALQTTTRGLADESMISSLLDALNDASFLVRGNAAACLATVSFPDRAIPVLVTALTDSHAFVAMHAATALRGARGDIAINALIQALDYDDSGVRGNVLDSLARFGTDAAFAAPKIQRSLRDEDEVVRSNAAYALAEVGDRSMGCFKGLLGVLNDSSPWVRASAVRSLRVFGFRSVLFLVIGFADRSPEVRWSTAFSLGEIGFPAVIALPLLIAETIGDSDLEVRSTSRAASRKIVIGIARPLFFIGRHIPRP